MTMNVKQRKIPDCTKGKMEPQHRQSLIFIFFFILPTEPNHFMDCNKSVPLEQLAKDFHTLRSILQSSPQFGHFIVGPDVTKILNHRKSASYLES